MDMNNYTLRNGFTIPSIGFGTWKSNGDEAVNAIKTALDAGYRHIDTAAMYQNEKEIGTTLKQTTVPREEIFITSKLRPQDRGYESTFRAFEKTISDLDVEYLDLYLIHWPANARSYEDWEDVNSDTWKAFEELHASGKIRSIGVSNFWPHHLDALLEKASVVPVVNQIEYHPRYMQHHVTAYCRQKNILVEAWSPLGRGAVLEHEIIVGIAKKYEKTPAQICIKWCLQNGTLPLPKSVTPERIKQNIEVFDFIISDEDMKTINELPQLGYSGLHPDEMVF